jgi:hypothetical protein
LNATLKKMIAEHEPRFVLFYGTGLTPLNAHPYSAYWSEIAGLPLVENTPAKNRSTVFVFTKHPTAHGIRTDFWIALGRTLRALQ